MALLLVQVVIHTVALAGRFVPILGENVLLISSFEGDSFGDLRFRNWHGLTE